MFTPTDKHQAMRRELWQILYHGRGRTGHAYTFVSVMLILLSVSILPLELIDSLSSYHDTLLIMEIIFTALFTVDYCLHIYATPNRARYVFSWHGIIDLLSILPFFIGLLGTPYLRIFRLVRLLRFWQFDAAASEDETEIMEEGIGMAGDEHVEYIISHHPIYLLLNALPAAVAASFAIAIALLFEGHPISLTFAGILFVFCFIFLWRTWLNYSYDVIYITSKRLVFYDQFLLGRSINQINFNAVTNVKPMYPNVISYVLRYGDLTIETPATEQGHIELHMVRSHEKAAQMIMKKCLGRTPSVLQREDGR